MPHLLTIPCSISIIPTAAIVKLKFQKKFQFDIKYKINDFTENFIWSEHFLKPSFLHFSTMLLRLPILFKMFFPFFFGSSIVIATNKFIFGSLGGEFVYRHENFVCMR